MLVPYAIVAMLNLAVVSRSVLVAVNPNRNFVVQRCKGIPMASYGVFVGCHVAARSSQQQCANCEELSMMCMLHYHYTDMICG